MQYEFIYPVNGLKGTSTEQKYVLVLTNIVFFAYYGLVWLCKAWFILKLIEREAKLTKLTDATV